MLYRQFLRAACSLRGQLQQATAAASDLAPHQAAGFKMTRNASGPASTSGVGIVRYGTFICAPLASASARQARAGRINTTYGTDRAQRLQQLASASTWVHPLYRSASGARQLCTFATGRSAAPTDALAPGCMIEFRKDDRLVLALVKRAEGKKAWVAVDARGVEYTVRGQQVAFVVPGTGYEQADVARLAEHAEANADDSLLKMAWEVIQDERDTLYDVRRMADLLYGSDAPEDCYATQRLLSVDRQWFKQAGRSPPLWQPRSAGDVAAIQKQLDIKAKAAEAEERFLQRVAAVRVLPRVQRPGREEWLGSTDAGRVQALLGYALHASTDSAANALAMTLLRAMQMLPTPNAAVALLQEMGVLQAHEPVQLYRVGATETFDKELEAAAVEAVAAPCVDPLAGLREDLTHLPVLVIDDPGTEEVDDGLSAIRLADGRLQVWVHVADPTRWLQHNHPLVAEARRRTKTIYTAVGKLPMFPAHLAAGVMSLRPASTCTAMSISATLESDGSCSECRLVGSTIAPQPRHSMTYADADELLEEAMEQQEPELHLLAQVAALRRQWRESQGSVEFTLPEASVRVELDGEAAPVVSIESLDQRASASRQMVAECMILAGEAVGRIGSHAGLPLPYRGQPAPVIPEDANLDSIPPGHCRNAELRRYMRGARFSARVAAPHAGLGLPAYVQFTSPIRRLGDLYAHYQLQAWLAGKPLPFDTEMLEVMLEGLQEQGKLLYAAESEVESYWIATYFQQQTEANPERAWEALMLTWRHRDKGIACLLLEELGLEVNVPVSRPLQPGERLWMRCSHVDTAVPLFKLEECGDMASSSYVAHAGGAVATAV